MPTASMNIWAQVQLAAAEHANQVGQVVGLAWTESAAIC